MKVALVHHHLRPGGVPSVIRNAAEALRGFAGIETVLVAGDGPNEGLPFVRVPGLDYQVDAETSNPVSLAEAMLAAVPDADVWHVHNPTLGKNIHLPDALAELSRREEKLLLQIHDFAEDGRPTNLPIARSAKALYPAAHYVLINRRDLRILREAGLPEELCHFLPNAVRLDPTPASLPENRRPLLFYPARGIPRKNLGEAILLAAAAPWVTVASSATPDNPRWLPAFEEWKVLVDELGLSVELGVVGRRSPADLGINDSNDSSFESWYASADRILTTSCMEGFGLAFLESYAKGRSLMGRDLPAITSDFVESGLCFPGLYQSLEIPSEWADQPAGKFVDFASVKPEVQRVVIRRVSEDQHASEAIRVVTESGPSNTANWMKSQLACSPSELPLNRKAIAEHYSVERYAKRLMGIYDAVARVPATQAMICPDKVQEAFAKIS